MGFPAMTVRKVASGFVETCAKNCSVRFCGLTAQMIRSASFTRSSRLFAVVIPSYSLRILASVLLETSKTAILDAG